MYPQVLHIEACKKYWLTAVTSPLRISLSCVITSDEPFMGHLLSKDLHGSPSPRHFSLADGDRRTGTSVLSIFIGGVAPPTSSRRRVRGIRQLTYGLEGVVREPHLTTADEMGHRRERLLIVGRNIAHGLHDITQCQCLSLGLSHENRFLCTKVHGFYSSTRPWFASEYSKQDSYQSIPQGRGASHSPTICPRVR